MKVGEVIKDGLLRFLRALQFAVVAVCLFLIYVFGLGVTKLIVLVFDRRLLRLSGEEGDTFWTDADGYDETLDASMRQS